jgi:hypothetical protein
MFLFNLSVLRVSVLSYSDYAGTPSGSETGEVLSSGIAFA